MAKNPPNNKLTPSGYLSLAWPPFGQKLAAVLEKLEEDQYLILSVKGSHRFIQFAAQGSFGMRVETTSNSYLAKPERLNKRQISTLIDVGWHAPTGSPAQSTPKKDPDGSPNFFAEFSAPVPFEAVTNVTVRTFAEILGVSHPGFLQYESFDREGEAIALPELGVKQRAPGVDNPEDLSQILLATLRETTGISELHYDDDGDIAIRYGSALTFVRLAADPPCVLIHASLLRDVEESPQLFARLNDINASERLMRFVFKNGAIYGVADISAVPFVRALVVQTILHFCAIAGGIDRRLQAEFGGRTAFVELMPRSMKH
jgi:hypothetical protein